MMKDSKTGRHEGTKAGRQEGRKTGRQEGPQRRHDMALEIAQVSELVGLGDGAVDIADDNLGRLPPQVETARHLVPARLKHNLVHACSSKRRAAA
jgi:hypothetical protein